MSAISRRDLFLKMLGRAPSHMDSTAIVSEDGPQLALILDRFCLAWQNSFCSVCVERCPVDGAIIVQQGKPRVNPDLCNGCRICHDTCPAPKNAVFLVSRKPRQGMVIRQSEPIVS